MGNKRTLHHEIVKNSFDQLFFCFSYAHQESNSILSYHTVDGCIIEDIQLIWLQVNKHILSICVVFLNDLAPRVKLLVDQDAGLLQSITKWR